MPARNPRATAGSAASATSGPRAAGARSRRRPLQTASSTPASKANGAHSLAERVGTVTTSAQTFLARLGPFAPAALAMATRYARRHPLRMVLIAGALLYVGRRWWSPDDTAAVAAR